MNPFDIVIIVILGYCLIRGIFRGLIKELSSIVGVFGGFYAAYTYYSQVSTYLGEWIDSRTYLDIVSFLIVFCLVFIVISILGVIIKYIMNIAFLGWIDRIFGAVFGVLKGVLIASILLIILTAFLPPNVRIVKNSRLAPHVTSISEQMVLIVPEKMKQNFVGKIDEIKKEWEKSR
ncbi:MAG: CvpA family protein [Desulfobacterales bacterium]|nr:CvpA family protein [Desulfobacterales bacterium]MDD4071957.1 CvpA family protein [Desulfobacterales bacterium]MDD4392093.1 CvpA family protein [Desulfobacterales bacterium]